MQNTTNYNLNKPDGNDFVKIQALNENADIIDAALKSLSDALGGIDLTTLSQAIASVDNRITTHLDEMAQLVCRANANQSISDSTVTTLFIDSTVFSYGDGLVLQNSSEILVTKDGDYEIEGVVMWDINATGLRQALINANNGLIAANSVMAISNRGTSVYVQSKVALSAGTIIRLQVEQNSGSALSTVRNGNAPYLSVKRVQKREVV